MNLPLIWTGSVGYVVVHQKTELGQFPEIYTLVLCLLSDTVYADVTGYASCTETFKSIFASRSEAQLVLEKWINSDNFVESLDFKIYTIQTMNIAVL